MRNSELIRLLTSLPDLEVFRADDYHNPMVPVRAAEVKPCKLPSGSPPYLAEKDGTTVIVID